jgi:predicted transcriptional regulator
MSTIAPAPSPPTREAAGISKDRELVRHVITIAIPAGSDYITDLKERMRKLKISQNQLAAAMNMTPSQVSRWMTENAERRVMPSIASALEIETALLTIQEQRKDDAKKKK